MEITLSNGMITLVDEGDYPELAIYRWTASPSNGWRKTSPGARVKWYACRWTQKGGVRKKIYMHREIMRAPKHLVVDHIDGNSLNNRRENLRRCRQATNCQNVYTGPDNSDVWA